MKTEIYNPTEDDLKTLNDINFKGNEHKSGICIAYNQDKTLKCAIWGAPKQLVRLYLELQDRLPEGVIEYANMIREVANDIESESLAAKTPTHNTIN